MSKINKYGINNLRADFPTDDKCLDFLFDTLHSRKCSCGGAYKRITGRKQFQCSKCRFQIAPTAGTIFHKSDTPLTLWFHAIFIFSNAKSGISAKEMERQLNVTYKCAWRILSLIRKALVQKGDFLKGDVEMDEAYFGGKGYGGKQNQFRSQNLKDKSIIIGAVERKGKMRAKVTKDASSKTIGKFLQENVNQVSSRLFTDESNRYHKVARGFDRFVVTHKDKEFVRGIVHVNNIESFWAHLKRSIQGTHKVISKKHLQSYVDAFVWHYNNRHNDRQRFSSLLGALLPVLK